MKITKLNTMYEIEHEGRLIKGHVLHFSNKTHFDEEKVVTLESGNKVTDRVRVLELDRCVSESDIERVLAEALA